MKDTLHISANYVKVAAEKPFSIFVHNDENNTDGLQAAHEILNDPHQSDIFDFEEKMEAVFYYRGWFFYSRKTEAGYFLTEDGRFFDKYKSIQAIEKRIHSQTS